MNFEGVDAVFARKHRALRSIREIVAPLSPAQRAVRPGDDAWSINEIVEHLVLVESGVLRLLRILIQKAGSVTGDARQPVTGRISLPDGFEDSRNGRIRTASVYEPTGKVTMEEATTKLQSIQEEFTGLGPRLTKLNLEGVSFRHDTLGSLTLGQWLAFIPIHEERHLRQIRSIIDSAGLGGVARGR